MAKRDGSDPGKKPSRYTVTGTLKAGSGLGRAKDVKPPSSSSRATNKNLVTSTNERKAAPTTNRSVSSKAGKILVKTRTKAINRRDAAPSKAARKALVEAALAHHDRPITAAEARRMNEIIKADRPVPPLRPRRR